MKDDLTTRMKKAAEDAQHAAYMAENAAQEAQDAADDVHKAVKELDGGDRGDFAVLAEAVRDHERARYTDPRTYPADGPDRELYDRLHELEAPTRKSAA